MKAHENPTVNDQSGKRLQNLQKVRNTIKEHFQNHFNGNSHESIESIPNIFHNKITNDEVKNNMKLSNRC